MMGKAMSKKTLLSIMTGVGLLAGASFAQACTTDAWLGGVSGDAVAGGPAEATTLPRYSGLCSAQASNGYVQDNSPANETRMITRFYFLADSGSTGSATIYSTLSDEPSAGAAGTAVYTVSFDASTDMLTFNAAGGGSTTASAGSGWNSVEIDWQSGGTMNIWVNSDAATAPSATTSIAGVPADTIDSARLGADNPSGTISLLFDDYEARRTTAVGRLLVCDANANGSVTIADAVTVLLELGGTIATGQADCNENGGVTIADAVTALLSL